MKIVELEKERWKDFKLHFRWSSSRFYKVDVKNTEDGWVIELKRQSSEEEIMKDYQEPIWEQWMDDESNNTSQIFGVEVNGKIVAWMTVAKEVWNNRLRIHELLVLEEHRGKGVGKMLIEKAKQVAQELNCRAIVLETQTNNSAVEFYRKQGFELNGVDLTAYSNSDITNNEVRIDMVYKIKD